MRGALIRPLADANLGTRAVPRHYGIRVCAPFNGAVHDPTKRYVIATKYR